MKKLFIGLLALTSVSAFATEFSVLVDNIHCTIKGNEVVRTQTYGKEVKASFVEKKFISLQNIESFVQKAVETTTNTPSDLEGFKYEMTHEGTTYLLNYKDSDESQILVHMLSRICR